MAGPANVFAGPILSLDWERSDDPTGNGQETWSQVWRLADGSKVTTGLWVQKHGGQKLRMVHGGSSPSGVIGDVFELDANGRILIIEL